MSFYSTRGGACVTASQAILWGLAKDGGLYVPSMFPQLSRSRIFGFCDLSYQKTAERMCCAAFWRIIPTEISEAVQAAYSPANFDDPAGRAAQAAGRPRARDGAVPRADARLSRISR